MIASLDGIAQDLLQPAHKVGRVTRQVEGVRPEVEHATRGYGSVQTGASLPGDLAHAKAAVLGAVREALAELR